MKTVSNFFRRVFLFLCVCFLTVSFSLSAAVFLGESRVFMRSFHFLVLPTDNTQAAAGVSGLDGGAGYVMQSGTSVALGVYFTLAQAEEVLSRVQIRYPETEIVTFSTEKFHFKGKKEKRKADKIVASFSTLYEYLWLVFDESVRLENGGTQESSKRILGSVSRQLSFLGKENESVDEEIAKTCAEASEKIFLLTEKIVYAKDLRYFLCEYAERYIALFERYRI